MGKKRRSPEMSSGTKDSGNYSEFRMSEMIGTTSIPKIVHKGERMDIPKTRQCYSLVTKLLTHRHGWVFKQPVDPRALNIPDYFDIISNPMDLGTVKKKLVSKQYDSTDKFAADVRLTFSNAMVYNPPGNEVHSMAQQLNNIFNSEWRVLEGRWRKVNSGPEQHTAKVTQVQAVTVKSSVQKDPTGRFEPLPTKPLAKAEQSQSAQVTKKQGCARVLFKDLEKSTVKVGRFSASISCIQEQKKIAVMQVSEHNFDFDGKEAYSYCTAPSAQSMTSEKEEDDDYLYEQQLSPSKALRAAMLRSRFAGTIVKAQQKALLDQGRKLDPVKLQLEKEKLEKKQQEEKARIEAQVKAAEVAAQKKAEAEKKMRREKEREAARLALQMMKKTVDIDNTDFVKDLENLCEKWQLYSPGALVVDVVAGDELQHGHESPLERLGLFMKKDDIEEEIGDWISATDNGDIEDGEIG